MNRTFNVLLVEDDPILGEVAVEALALLGHRVTWVTTAAAAFDALRISHTLEVVLLDLRLGDVSGETIFEKLQLLNITYPPVIVLSAEPTSVLRHAAQRIKTSHIVQKPASIQEIDRALQLAVASA
jgi:DNA-binding response OmpR family regulator